MKKKAMIKIAAKSGPDKRPTQKHKLILTLVISAALIVFGVTAIILSKQSNSQKVAAGTTTTAQLSTEGDLVIPISGISKTATFYPVTVDGTKLEVLAVKALDGTIRTAFNTCQVCYDSGRGYYKQDGDILVCQNCGNRFPLSAVEVEKGGCNPVPIFAENKTIDTTTITIHADYLKLATQIFQNWKTN